MATDVGGTFTDVVYCGVDESTGEMIAVKSEKAHTTPSAFERGVLDAIEKTGKNYSDIDFLAHGSTVVINAITKRKGVKTALITTRGFRDILEIGRGNRPDFFNLRFEKQPPFVPRHLRKEVTERLNFTGEVLTPLAVEELADIVAALKKENVEAIAVCFLHAYANNSHEKAAVDELRRLWPEVSVIASHQVSREWREYERVNTTVISAFVHPIAASYLTNMEAALQNAAFDGAFYVMRSNGGIDTSHSVKNNPVSIVESGPASGVLGAAVLGKILDIDNVIAFDIGGTTAKCSLIENGMVSITSRYMVEKDECSAGYPITTPVVDIVEIGNGGGSIGWVDDFGKLHIGPKSAGAFPGPVAYGKGGVAPTTTDANLLLGRINPKYFVDGEIEADMDAVNNAFSKLGGTIGLSAEEAARGVIRIANNNMANALKLISINRGHDPRDYTMIAFGGGGALHATSLARDLSIPTVIIPAHSAVFSAWGMLMLDLRRDFIQTLPTAVTDEAAPRLSEKFISLGAEAIAAYEAEGIDAARVYFERFVDMRYEGQDHTVRIPLEGAALDGVDIPVLLDRFHAAYEREYGYRLHLDAEILNIVLIAYATIDKPQLSEIAPCSDLANAIKGEREVDFEEFGLHMATIYDRDRLGAGIDFTGPAVIEEAGGTTVVFPGEKLSVDRFGNLHITLREKRS